MTTNIDGFAETIAEQEKARQYLLSQCELVNDKRHAAETKIAELEEAIRALERLK